MIVCQGLLIFLFTNFDNKDTVYLPVSIIPLFYDNFVLFRSLKYTMPYNVFDYFFNEKKNVYIKRQTHLTLSCFQNSDIYQLHSLFKVLLFLGFGYYFEHSFVA